MSLVKIPSLAPVIGLSGDEPFETVQGGVSKRVTANQIAVLSGSQPGAVAPFIMIAALPAYPNSRGLDVEAGVLALTDQGAQGEIIISVVDGGVTNVKLADMADRTVKANISGATETPADVSLAQLQGAIYEATNITASGAYAVPTTALSLVINKTDGAPLTLPALALKVGPVKIIAAQATAFPFTLNLTDGTYMGLSSVDFTYDYQTLWFFPNAALNVWTP